MRAVAFDGEYDSWLLAAKAALYSEQRPEEIQWVDSSNAEAASLWEEEQPFILTSGSEARFHVPKRFFEIAKPVSCHHAPERWSLLYRILWRLTHGEPQLLNVSVDADTHELLMLEKAVNRDVHKMRAFVRFREIETEDGAWFVAWYEPQHYTVPLNAGFFRDRFASMRWSILTPDRSMHWDGTQIRMSEGVDRSQAPAEDAVEDLWRTYYGSIFNPARLKVQTMTSHMARHFWKNLPEAQDIPGLVAEAPARTAAMRQLSDSKLPVLEYLQIEIPDTHDIGVLAEALQKCRGCPLWKDATCGVFGEGPTSARILVVGEQPGDQEDRAGRPFVGPAGQLLNRAFLAAGLKREEMYVTNAVKHFKWTPRGKQRIHAKPSAREVAACRPWLETEIKTVKPELIICLGATAASSVCGPGIRVTESRGEFLNTEFGVPALVTLHPSALLRLPDGADPEVEFKRFVADLTKAVRQ